MHSSHTCISLADYVCRCFHMMPFVFGVASPAVCFLSCCSYVSFVLAGKPSVSLLEQIHQKLPEQLAVCLSLGVLFLVGFSQHILLVHIWSFFLRFVSLAWLKNRTHYLISHLLIFSWIEFRLDFSSSLIAVTVYFVLQFVIAEEERRGQVRRGYGCGSSLRQCLPSGRTVCAGDCSANIPGDEKPDWWRGCWWVLL